MRRRKWPPGVHKGTRTGYTETLDVIRASTFLDLCETVLVLLCIPGGHLCSYTIVFECYSIVARLVETYATLCNPCGMNDTECIQ